MELFPTSHGGVIAISHSCTIFPDKNIIVREAENVSFFLI